MDENKDTYYEYLVPADEDGNLAQLPDRPAAIDTLEMSEYRFCPVFRVCFPN